MIPIASRRRPRCAFTLVELIVVITVIGVILAIAIPGLSSMQTQARLNGAIQTISGALTRAQVAAVADRNLTAVRFLPGEWDFDESRPGDRDVGRQHLVTYTYACSRTREVRPGVFTVDYYERFERRPGSPSVALPADFWAAPLESLIPPPSSVGTDTLSGQIGTFELDAAASGQFLDADDFLIVFDPATGLQTTAVPSVYRLKAYDPNQGSDFEAVRDPSGRVQTAFQRRAYSGVVLYRREPFVALGFDATAAVRQEYLRRTGRPFAVHRFGGGLVMGSP